ncbi:M50 family metallopeptidase [Pseudonocardia parietis]|uniref:Membrane-associated protease RseP (Regulator of RpoE activity) n=1 Tax=Pseudonocardia parietis TaxID=570936 RepID=A0ABS4W2A0_9PSEU|nr:site-2 protease family protein [Pseudonocardia parietis]MBP2370073.1 membrane-associated protease RseP (regulator of RpoE activity) [Pseudonocardia parietis]
MTVLWTIVGIAIFFFGLLVSIAWHELGHFATARWFGIKVPEFMVGFGKTVWSVKRGETEYGVKAIPLGGYVRMIGMLPPAPGQGRLGRSRRTGPFQGLMDDARAQSQMDVLPQDADRQFWTRAPWKRIIVMFAGPFMNLILAIGLFAGILMGIGIQAGGTQVSAVSECVLPATASAPVDDRCPAGAPLAPAAAAGMLPGDRIVSLAGREYGPNDGMELREAIRVTSGPTPIVVERNGQRLPLTVDVIENQVADFADPDRAVTAGFLGVGLLPGDYVQQSPGEVVEYIGGVVAGTAEAITQIPSRVPALFGAAFLGEERSDDSPMGVVGVSRIGGEILAQEDAPWQQDVGLFLNMLAAVNVSLFLLNLLPIPPLDGGQIVPAIWESIKRNTARAFGRPDPGPVDAAKLLPFAYVFVLVFLGFSVVVAIADIVNPVRIFG